MKEHVLLDGEVTWVMGPIVYLVSMATHLERPPPNPFYPPWSSLLVLQSSAIRGGGGGGGGGGVVAFHVCGWCGGECLFFFDRCWVMGAGGEMSPHSAH